MYVGYILYNIIGILRLQNNLLEINIDNFNNRQHFT
jgi:hypothetical protein